MTGSYELQIKDQDLLCNLSISQLLLLKLPVV
jgi:hypothetical protein